jgi:DNA relaxase NicK
MAKKFTKSQRETLEAFKIHIVTFEPGAICAALASLQLKITTTVADEHHQLEWIKLWCGTLMELLDHLFDEDNRKDFSTMINKMIEVFPEHFNKVCVEDINIH